MMSAKVVGELTWKGREKLLEILTQKGYALEPVDPDSPVEPNPLLNVKKRGVKVAYFAGWEFQLINEGKETLARYHEELEDFYKKVSASD
jgi:hypothetical protein